MPSGGSISNWILLVWSVPVLPVCQDTYSIRVHFAAWKPECFFSGNFNPVFIFYALKKASHLCTAKLLPVKIILITFIFFLFCLFRLYWRDKCVSNSLSLNVIFTQYAPCICILRVMYVLSKVRSIFCVRSVAVFMEVKRKWAGMQAQYNVFVTERVNASFCGNKWLVLRKQLVMT